MKKLILLGIMAAFVLTASQASAQSIGFSLTEINFGEVEMGESLSSVLRVSSLGPTPLAIYSMGLSGENYDVPLVDPLPDFSIENYVYSPSFDDDYVYPQIPPEMVVDTYIDVELSFSPEELGLRESYFRVESNDPDGRFWYLPINGVGVDSNAVPEPATMLLFGLGAVGAFVRKRFV